MFRGKRGSGGSKQAAHCAAWGSGEEQMMQTEGEKAFMLGVGGQVMTGIKAQEDKIWFCFEKARHKIYLVITLVPSGCQKQR